MKRMLSAGLSSLTLLLSGCIAGAALDDASERQAAIQMPELRAPLLRIETLPAANPMPSREHPLQNFEQHMPVMLKGAAARMDDCWIRYERVDDRVQIGVRCADAPAWAVTLPAAFGMHDLQLARWSHRGQPHWVFTARSRHTTGRTAIVVTDARGEPVWRVSLSHAEVQQLEANAAGLLLTGLDGGRRQLGW